MDSFIGQKDLKNEWFVDLLSNNGEPLDFESGEYRLLISIYDNSPEQVYMARGIVEFLTLKNDIAPVVSNNEVEDPSYGASDALEPVTSASISAISESPLEIELDFGLSPDDLYGDQEVSYYEIWRTDEATHPPIKIGEVEHSQGIYVDSGFNNPSYPLQEGINYIYFIRTYDFDGNYADSINFIYNQT